MQLQYPIILILNCQKWKRCHYKCCPPEPHSSGVILSLSLCSSCISSLLIKIPSNVPRCQSSISGSDSAWYLHQQVQAQAFSAGGTDRQMSFWTQCLKVFSEEGPTFDMQIIVGTVAVGSFLAAPVLLLFPAWLHPHQCQLYIGSQQLPAISCFFALFCLVLFESTRVFVCHGNFTPAPRVGSVVFQQL